VTGGECCVKLLATKTPNDADEKDDDDDTLMMMMMMMMSFG